MDQHCNAIVKHTTISKCPECPPLVIAGAREFWVFRDLLFDTVEDYTCSTVSCINRG